MIKFEKVSYEQFKSDCDELGLHCDEEVYKNIKLPTRATSNSAGYDFYTPFDVTIVKGNTITIPTGIRFLTDQHVYLSIVPKSGLGCRYGLGLANTVGVVDGDYAYSDNEGEIFAKYVINDSCSNFAHVEKGNKIMQGIIVSYFMVDGDVNYVKRNGGFGSTGEK